MATKRNQSPIKNMIRESIEDLQKTGEFPDDPRMSDEQKLTGPERFEKKQKEKDEVIIDSLFSEIQGKEGYFIKLKKEMPGRPNEFMLMKVIESDWRKWPDVETAVADVVKANTKVNPSKWGTGNYRIEIACRGGMRGKGYDPREFYINAEEETIQNANGGINGSGTQQPINPDVAVASRIEELSGLVQMLSGVMPKPADPNVVQGQLADAFKQGMSMKISEGQNNNTNMMAMMTFMMGMMKEVFTAIRGNDGPKVVNPEQSVSGVLKDSLGVLKDFGVLGNNMSNQPKSLVEMVKELQVLGIDLLKKDDPLDQINKLKQIAGLAADFMGMGGSTERPSIIEKIVDILGPAVPKIISDIKASTDNAVKAQEIAGENIRNANQRMVSTNQGNPTTGVKQPIKSEEQTTYQKMGGGSHMPEKSHMPDEVVQDPVKIFLNQLYEAVRTNNRMFYPIIYTSLLQNESGTQLVQGIVNGTHTAKNLIDVLQQYGDDRFKESEFVMKSLVGYVNGLMIWIRSLAGVNDITVKANNVSKEKEFDAMCIICKSVFSYGSEDEFMSDGEKKCDIEGCEGTLEPIKKAV